VFNFSPQYSYRKTGGGLVENSLPLPSTRTETETFGSGVAGLTPWGLSSNLSGRVTDSHGTQGGNDFNNSSANAGLSVTQRC